MKLTVRIATFEDIDILKAFLEKAKLNTKGIDEMIDSFLIMEDEDGQLKATIGMEQFGASEWFIAFISCDSEYIRK